MIEIKPPEGRIVLSIDIEELNTLACGMRIAAELTNIDRGKIAIAAQELKCLLELHGRVMIVAPEYPGHVRMAKFGCDARTLEGRYQTRPLDVNGNSMTNENWVYVDTDHDDIDFTTALIEAFK